MAHGDYNCCAICDRKMEYSNSASTKEDLCASCAVNVSMMFGQKITTPEAFIAKAKELPLDVLIGALVELGYSRCSYSGEIDREMGRLGVQFLPDDSVAPADIVSALHNLGEYFLHQVVFFSIKGEGPWSRMKIATVDGKLWEKIGTRGELFNWLREGKWPELKECQTCGGSGTVCVGEWTPIITYDMAMDAGMPELAGAPYDTQYEWGECECCHGRPDACLVCTGRKGDEDGSEVRELS